MLTVEKHCCIPKIESVHPGPRRLCQLRQIRRSVPTDTFQTLVVSLVLTRLDYSNSVLAGLLVYLVRRLQSVLNAAARLTYHLRRSDHITDALVCLHWLHVPE